jgi:hypothetical protein
MEASKLRTRLNEGGALYEPSTKWKRPADWAGRLDRLAKIAALHESGPLAAILALRYW